jgi:molecular chaperone DnaK
MSITVPSIGATINPGHNFYSRQDAQIDFTDAAEIVRREADAVLERVDRMAKTVSDARILEARAKAREARSAADSPDPAVAKQAMDMLLQAKALLAQARAGHLIALREQELADEIAFFQSSVRQHAAQPEMQAFERMCKAARNCLTAASDEFERHRGEMANMSFRILWRQEHFVISLFRYWGTQAHRAGDKAQHAQLMQQGEAALQRGDIDELRKLVQELRRISVSNQDDGGLVASINILKG